MPVGIRRAVFPIPVSLCIQYCYGVKPAALSAACLLRSSASTAQEATTEARDGYWEAGRAGSANRWDCLASRTRKGDGLHDRRSPPAIALQPAWRMVEMIDPLRDILVPSNAMSDVVARKHDVRATQSCSGMPR